MIAHLGGVPVEEALLPLLPSIGIGLALARAWLAPRRRRQEEPPALSAAASSCRDRMSSVS